jgi:D-2-hydroxyglutarate dehydrogenase
MYLGMPSYARVLEVMRLARFHLQEIISATEFQDSAALALVQKHIPNAHSPLEGAVAADAAAGGATAHRFYMLIETAGGSAEHNRAKIDSFLEALFTKFGDEVDGTIAETDAQAKALWKLREGVPESAGKEGYVASLLCRCLALHLQTPSITSHFCSLCLCFFCACVQLRVQVRHFVASGADVRVC